MVDREIPVHDLLSILIRPCPNPLTQNEDGLRTPAGEGGVTYLQGGAFRSQVGITPEELAAVWGADPGSLGAAAVEPADGQQYLPGLMELITIPLAVNVASNIIYDLIRRLVSGLRQNPGRDDFEVVEVTTAQGDRVVVVRPSRGVS
jgi:hypothetical protein